MTSQTIKKSIKNLMTFWIDFLTDFGRILRAPTLNPTRWGRCFLRVRLSRPVANFHPTCDRKWSQNQCKIHPKTVPKSVQESDLFFYGFLTSKWSLGALLLEPKWPPRGLRKFDSKIIDFWCPGGGCPGRSGHISK